MSKSNLENIDVLVKGKPVEAKSISYSQPEKLNHEEYYLLSKKYEKFIHKLLSFTDKNKITKEIDEFIKLAYETKKQFNDNYADAYIYFKSIDDMIETLTTYKNTHI